MSNSLSSSIPSGFYRSDILFALGLISILILLILPVPKLLLDLLLAVSIAFSVLILMTSLLIEKPLDFSTFPTILLISTMIRLALNVASTRLILGSGHEGTHAAGKVIQAFGYLIMGGNFVIGLIIFAILLIVNFVVITKGSGRIAEVSARFSLDAMPGKQMAVDADLSAGLINEAEAKKRRKTLEEESNFFGSMDGAAKFVRGDAIAGLLITFINVIGGIIIGVLQMGLSFIDAARAYTVLTVGDGLVTQIPALIVSMAAGMLVSKAGIEGAANKAFFAQLGHYPTALGLSSFLMTALAFLPGMPMLPFLGLGIAAGLGAWKIQDLREKEETQVQAQIASDTLESQKAVEEPITDTLKMDQIRIELGYGLLGLLNTEINHKLTDHIKILRKQLAQDIGVILPSVRIVDNIQLAAQTYVIRIKDWEAGRGELRPSSSLIIDPQGRPLSLPGEETQEPTFGLPGKWISPSLKDEAERLGYTVIEPSTVLTTHLTEVVKDNLSELLTFADTQYLLEQIGEPYKKLLNDLIPGQISLGGVQRIFQNLVSERVSIRDLGAVLEALSEACSFTRNLSMMTEHIRQRLSRQITFSHTDPAGVLGMVSLSLTTERQFLEALAGEGEIKNLALSPSQLQDFIAKARQTLDKATLLHDDPVLVTSAALRPYVYSITARVRPGTAVLSQAEIHSKATIKNLGQI